MLGYPRAVVRVLVRELLALAISSAVFIVGPALTAWYVLSSPWHLATPWYLVGLPLGVVLSAIAAWAAWSVVTEVRERLGIRVVPQFERALDPGPDTYSSGRRIAARTRSLDAIAAAVAVRTLSHYGFARRDAGGEWFDAAHGSATVAALLAHVEPASELHAELSGLLRALRRAEDAGVGFRLVLVSGTAMNGALWEQLRRAGF